jgi:RND family efflux transporter MFP subunit
MAPASPRLPVILSEAKDLAGARERARSSHYPLPGFPALRMTSLALRSTVLCLLLVIISGCDRAPATTVEQRQAEPVTVTLASTRLAPVQRSVEVVGTLFGDEEMTVSAKVPGRIVELFKDVGDRAAGDDPLAQIERTDYELDRSRQELAMREVLAKLGLEELPGEQFDPAKVPTVERARLQAANAEAKFKRGQQLYNQTPPLISEQDFADLQTAYEVARSNHEVELLTARSLLAEAQTRRSQLEQSQQRLRDTTLLAPAIPNGGGARFAVAARLVSVGEYVREGTALFRLVADNPIKFRAAVPERYAARVRAGQEVHVRVAAYPEAFAGRISRINPQVDVTTRTFQIEALVPNDEGLLRPGSFATGSIVTHVDEQVTLAPQRAVVNFAGVQRVFTVADGKAVEIRVEPGVRQGEYIEIARGLEGETPLVVGNADKLAAGTPVIVQRSTSDHVTDAAR